jgi:hypothetical protein
MGWCPAGIHGLSRTDHGGVPDDLHSDRYGSSRPDIAEAARRAVVGGDTVVEERRIERDLP